MAKTGKRNRTVPLKVTLRGMFKRLEDRPVPDRLMSVVDQLDAAEAAAPRKKKTG